MKIIISESQMKGLKEAFSPEYITFKDLFTSAPDELKKRFMKGWDVKQRPDFHPEGNTLKHMMEVTKRAIKVYPNDIDMILAAFFHDIGKDEVYAINPKTGYPSAFGHENVSAQLVDKYADWIKDLGGDVNRIREIVASHMRIKKLGEMTPKKAKELENSPYFADFIKFKFIDKGGLKMMDVPSDLKILARKFAKYGNGLYLVGGAVRDMFLGKEPKDYDVTTDADPQRIKDILSKEGYEKIIPKGESFGVISVIINGEEYEIATFREDGTYTDGRRPDGVKFSTIDADAKRRDLTINALYYDILNDKVIDLVGGIDDISKGNIRTVGNPKERFGEDRIRILRAVRFAAVTGSGLDGEIRAEIKRDAGLDGVSKERVRDEFLKGILKAKSVVYYLGLLDELNLFPQIFPNLSVSGMFLESKNPVITIAALLKDNSPEKLQVALNNLKYSTDEVRKISSLVALKSLSPKTAVQLKRQINKSLLSDEDIYYFLKTVYNVNGDLIKAFIAFQPSVNGNDVARQYNLSGKALGDKIEELETENFKRMLNK